MHLVLDMSFGEDASRIRKGNAPEIMSLVRRFALNLLQRYKSVTPRFTIRKIRKAIGWSPNLMLTILSQDFS